MRRVLALSVLASTFLVREAHACSMPAPEEWKVEASAIDRTAPALTVARLASIGRGKGPEGEGCGGVTGASSCDDLGTIELALAGADETSEQVGFVVEHASGTAPNGLSIPSTPIAAPGGRFTLVFVDGAEDDQEPLDFVLRVAAIDRAGNRSQPATVAVSHGGVNHCGAHVAPSGLSRAWPWGVVALACLARRRRSPR